MWLKTLIRGSILRLFCKYFSNRYLVISDQPFPASPTNFLFKNHRFPVYFPPFQSVGTDQMIFYWFIPNCHISVTYMLLHDSTPLIDTQLRAESPTKRLTWDEINHLGVTCYIFLNFWFHIVHMLFNVFVGQKVMSSM